MDFFGLEDQARRSTRKLILLFFLAIVCIVLTIYVATVHLFVPPQGFEQPTQPQFLNLFSHINLKPPAGMPLEDWLLYRNWWYPQLFLVQVVLITALILGGTLYKTGQLRRGGQTIATLLGGRPVRPDTTDANERRLLNIVEEMAIASGTPVPALYLLEQEPGINAFAAGFSRQDMVIGVTRGCLVLLSRDELQGVIAHEFSHILRGDMRLNMRLMGTVFGITMISMIGYFILRVGSIGFRRGSGKSRFNRRRGGGLGVGVLVFGVLLYVVGYLGVFFGNLIKSAIARQREFLADASAVQFTRNPAGLAGALKKIGGLEQGSRILSPHAHEASHFYFSNGLRSSFFRILATHPPLAARILRLDPSFTGEYPAIKAPEIRAAVREETHPAGKTSIRPDRFIAGIGALTADQIDYAAGLRKKLPAQLVDAVRDPVGASAVVLSLLLSAEEPVRNAQMRRLKTDAPPAVSGEIAKLAPQVRSLGTDARIPLADWALPALRNLSESQYAQFRSLMEMMISADGRVDLFEFCLQRMLQRHMDAQFGDPRPPRVKYFKTEDVLPEALYLLSTLAWAGQSSETDASKAFQAGAGQLNLSQRRSFTSAARPEGIDFGRIDGAFRKLALAGPYVKKNLLFACAHTVAYDGRILAPEQELLRVIADALDLPVPPFVQQITYGARNAG